MKKLFILGLMVFSTASFAQRYAIVDCQVQSPCKFVSKSNLGYCVGTASIRINDGHHGSHMVVSKQNTDGREVFLQAADIPVLSGNRTRMAGATRDGENSFDIRINGPVGRGTLTLEQDFEFNILCK